MNARSERFAARSLDEFKFNPPDEGTEADWDEDGLLPDDDDDKKSKALVAVDLHGTIVDKIQFDSGEWEKSKGLEPTDWEIVTDENDRPHVENNKTGWDSGPLTENEAYQLLAAKQREAVNKALVAVDLHGTIADKNEQPQDGALDSLNELRADGHEIGVFSCGATDEVKAWLDEHGMPYDYVNEEIPTRDSVKPDADVTIDNSAISHDGNWNDTMARLYSSGRLEKSMTVRVKAAMEECRQRYPTGDRRMECVEDGKRVSVTKPSDSKVDEVYQALLREGKDEGTAARIAQAQTGEALATGRAPKKFAFVGKSRTGGEVWYRS